MKDKIIEIIHDIIIGYNDGLSKNNQISLDLNLPITG